jgi:hypothetical protein
MSKVSSNVSLLLSSTQQQITDDKDPLFLISKSLNLPFNW